MRISELAARSDVSVATIKYYLREKLLHDGRLTSATQAQYDDSHLARLRLIRALIGPGGLSIATARAVLHEIDEPKPELLDMLGAVQHALVSEPPPESRLEEARALIKELGWWVDPADTAAIARLQEALDGLASAEFTLPDGLMATYAESMHTVAHRELANAPTDSPAAAIRYAVLGTILIEPLLIALRRLAHQDATARLFPRRPD